MATRIRRHIKSLGGVGVLCLLVTVAGCSTTSQTRRAAERDAPASHTHDRGTIGADSARAPLRIDRRGVSHRLQTVAQDWMGVPYQWGGTTKRGVDCSAFVRAVYKQALKTELPRQTVDQIRLGTPIRRANLQAGDLVFFRPKAGRSHVGIYLHDQSFLHASRSEGVTTGSLESRYWTRRYRVARRILTVSSVPEALASELLTQVASATPSAGTSRRNGW